MKPKGKIPYNKKHNREILKAFSLMTQMGVTLIVIMLLSVFIGNFIDQKANTSPIFTLIFSFIGIATAFRELYLLGMKHK